MHFYDVKLEFLACKKNLRGILDRPYQPIWGAEPQHLDNCEFFMQQFSHCPLKLLLKFFEGHRWTVSYGIKLTPAMTGSTRVRPLVNKNKHAVSRADKGDPH
jgi:hypothetical protein